MSAPSPQIYPQDTTFPTDFVGGAASASYQIEGAWKTDGKGLSVWDMLTRQPGKISEGHTGNVACDHYHRYQEDVGLMKDVGIKAYRLSVSWPRVCGGWACARYGVSFLPQR